MNVQSKNLHIFFWNVQKIIYLCTKFRYLCKVIYARDTKFQFLY